MDTRETPAAKAAEAAAPPREHGNICALATQGTFLTQGEMVLAQTGLCWPVSTQKLRVHMQSINLLPKRCSILQISLQIKIKAKINIEMRLNANLRMKMTWTICLATRYGNENSSMMLKNKVLMINS